MSGWLLRKWVIATCTSFAACSTALAVLFVAPCDFPSWYTKNLRTDFFTASLTMAAFLFTIATFIVPIVKSGVYDTKSYRQRLASVQQVNAQPGTLYGPLRSFSSLLMWATAFQLACAAVHVFLGFVPIIWATAVCAAIGAATAAMVVFAVLAARVNLKVWLDHEETNGTIP